MKNSTTALSLPTSSLQPKPTKTEILDAMVARAKVKHDAENESRQIKREALRVKIEKAAIKAMKMSEPSVYISTGSEKYRHCDVRFHNIKTPELDLLIGQYDEVNGRIFWDEKEVRKAIRDEINGSVKQSPSRLLDNPDVVAAMDATLKQWGI